MMALVAGQRSTLNPYAPLFVPAVYRQVEDFSPEWWELVKTSTWFRDFWLSQHPEGSFEDDVVDSLPDSFDLEVDDAQFEEMMMAMMDDDDGSVDSMIGSPKMEKQHLNANIVANEEEKCYKFEGGLHLGIKEKVLIHNFCGFSGFISNSLVPYSCLAAHAPSLLLTEEDRGSKLLQVLVDLQRKRQWLSGLQRICSKVDSKTIKPAKERNNPKSPLVSPKYQMKPAYCVSSQCTPRRIHQPR